MKLIENQKIINNMEKFILVLGYDNFGDLWEHIFECYREDVDLIVIQTFIDFYHKVGKLK